MARGRKPLDPVLRLQRRQESLQRYAERNAEVLRAAARLRMQRWVLFRGASMALIRTPCVKKRAEIAAADYKTKAQYTKKAREASEKYRDKKGEEERAANAAKRLLRKKNTSKPTTKSQCRGESRPTKPSLGLVTKHSAYRSSCGCQVNPDEGRAHRHVSNNEGSLSDDDSRGERHRRRSESPFFQDTSSRAPLPHRPASNVEMRCPLRLYVYGVTGVD
ncbi:hypothetical protein B0H13DRAFT_2374518 [Mycena leptocephala]|nr:hypothetical protein B0H13DRAFT_2374518 [Mycena leptocephala]